MPMERLTFPGHAGAPLAARLDLPEGPHLATALFAHCFACGEDIAAARRIAQRLAAMGIAVLRFDFTGLGHSGGEFGNARFAANVQDLEAAARHLETRGMAPDLLIGHSLAGAAVLKTAPRLGNVKALVTIGAPFDPDHVARNFAPAHPTLTPAGVIEMSLGGRTVRVARDFADDIAAERLEPAIAGLNRALLVMHATRDGVVGIENAHAIFRTAGHPKSFVTLDDADHLVSDPADAEYAADMIAAWVARRLGLQAPPPPPGAPEGIVRVCEIDPEGFLQDVQHGPHHHALADEPEAYGGTNRGMSPYGFLAAGLGACTSMTLRLYARRKGWPLAHLRVDVTHDKVHAQDAAHGAELKIDRFIREITLEGELDADQRARLLQVADKCPVHQTLTRSSKVETRLRD
ncbi:bifunctional alpha/beta hydrolase/OsmC family protein [Actibacterium sp. MT2.3-13A]|uniref:bifunctional alpha/beta hydrolase/OsmC family protein n=1 Tax=Actibacterium sp. MT2.3-13A TaxID=2828332 RepID=UPI001BA777DF|nr:bifunctional alpha/beta hydrolase/OsmC family protein [Actibacterium sp. MT2.3-13A]